MKNTTLTRSLTIGACTAFFVTQLAVAGSPREHLSLDRGWKFHLADDWPGALRLDATKFEGWLYEGADIYRQVWLPLVPKRRTKRLCYHCRTAVPRSVCRTVG